MIDVFSHNDYPNIYSITFFSHVTESGLDNLAFDDDFPVIGEGISLVFITYFTVGWF